MQAETHVLTSPFRWTTHPLVDMGVASLLVFANKQKPEDLTGDDLSKFADYIEGTYVAPELSAILGVLFTSNFIPINPNPKIPPNERKAKFRAILQSFASEADPTLPTCAYCGRPSVQRVSRDLVPMLGAREDINFFPDGELGLPLCGCCIVALQALAIGALVCNERGFPARALIVSCDDPQFLLDIVKAWQQEIRKRVHLSNLAKEKQSQINWSRTRTIETLAQIDLERQYEQVSSVTVFRLRNHLRGPTADILFLPSSVIRFLQKARAAKHRDAWLRIVNDAWQAPPKTKAQETSDVPAERTSLRNYLFEDLFDLPEAAGRFIRVYFLRRAKRRYIAGLWDVADLFLREVIGMESVRIEAIRKLGDSLAAEISTQDNRSLWGRASRAKRYGDVRLLLIRLNERRIKRGDPPAVSFDEFLHVFEEGEGLPRVDYLLAWDLVLIRVIEKLHEAKWFDRNRDVLEEENELETEEV